MMPRGRIRTAVGLALVALSMAGARTSAAQEPPARRIVVTAGQSTVLGTDFPIVRIAVTNPAVADAAVVQPREVLIDGRAPGTVSLIVWGAAGERSQYDIVVEPPTSMLQRQLTALFPGEDIKVNATSDAVVLSGRVSTNAVALRAAEIAEAVSGKVKVVNLLQVPSASDTQQVMLQVRIGEVRHNVLTEAGLSLFTGPLENKDWMGRVTTQQFAAPAFDDAGKLTFSDFLNLFVFSSKFNVGGMLKALQTRGLFQMLAEPNLIAYNGREASFLAGGEIPIPVVQGLTNAVSIQYKEYGVRLAFTPTIAGDVIHLKVRPEVSTLDFLNGVTLSGFRIPALTTRRVDTEVELRDGQSFAVAGLLNNISQLVRQQVPGLGNLPIIGPLFRGRSNSQERTELLVIITPYLVRPQNPDELPSTPIDPTQFLPPDKHPGAKAGPRK